MTFRIFFICIFSVLLFSSCGLYFNIHNPKRPGKMPEFSKEMVLLGEMTTLRSCYDIKYYDLNIKFFPDEKKLTGKVSMTAIATSPFDSIQIDLHPNLSIEKLIDKATGKSLLYYRNERAVIITYHQEQGNSFELEISYSGKPYIAKYPPWVGGAVWKKDKNKNYWAGVACESDGASLWWPLKDHTADEADSVRMHYSIDGNLMVVGNGQFEGVTKYGNENTYNWFVSYPINSYNISFYIGDFEKFSYKLKGVYGDTIPIEHYVLKQNIEKAKIHFKQVDSILLVYESLFGKYPWIRDGFRLVESPFEGMEHQSAIAYGNGYKNARRTGLDYVILHETAHEWWGNSITASDFADVWLQEGFATYAEALFIEAKNGKDAYEQYMNNQRFWIANKYPVVGVRDRRWFHYRKSADVYYKGSWILHTFRYQIENDSLFFDIIKTFYDTNKYKIVTTKDFTDIVNLKTGKDYNWFFDRYLTINTVPELQYYFSQDGAIYYKWTNVDSTFSPYKSYIQVNGQKQLFHPTNTVQKYLLPAMENGTCTLAFYNLFLMKYKKNKSLEKEYNK